MRRLISLVVLSLLTISLTLGCKERTPTPIKKHNLQAIFTPSAPKPIGSYSQAVLCHNTLYISGQIGLDPETMLLATGSIESQIRQVFDNLSAVIKASGATMSDVTKLTIYLTDLNNSNKVYEIMNDYFKQPYPARSLVAVSALPRRAKIEIDAIVEKTK